ncbi:MMPL family transporter [Streptomyces paludis]|uniref:MMPL family transporter n=1 Tax=Streptomyces paludis TaxID=2282738 RepID=A0A345HMY6_9ACTN|nr:MMPL family transporter [Streptomyces paludis]
MIGVWLSLLAVIGGLGVTMAGSLSTQFSIPGLESQRAQDLLEKKMPGAESGTARVVIAAPAGGTLTTAGHKKAIETSLDKVSGIPGVEGVANPFETQTISPDRRIAYADVRFRQSADEVSETSKDALSDAMDDARRAGLAVEFDGPVMESVLEGGELAEVAGVVIAFVVLALALGSIVAAGLPLLTAFVGVGIGVLGVQFISGFVDMTSTANVLALMIGLAVGIDYALFIIARHREQLADPDTGVEESIARAVATAGSAVVFAGATVVIALAALAVIGIPFLAVMGLAAAATVLLAVLVAITLVPAVLGVAGDRLRPRPRTQPRPRSRPTEQGRGAAVSWSMAWGRAVTRRPLLVLLVGVIGLLALAWPAKDLRLGLPSGAAQPVASTQHKAYDLVAEGFGDGFNATLTAVADTGAMPAAERQRAVGALRDTLALDPGVAYISEPVVNPDATVSALSIVPKTGPDDEATTDLVHRLREQASAFSQQGGTLYIAGGTAAAIDVSAKLSEALPLFIAIIVILAVILLTVAFRSLLVPLKAVLGFLLSVAASLGCTVWIFQNGHLNGLLGIPSAGPVTSFLPVVLIGVLFGLAMDYEVFLVSRMREHHEQTRDAAAAVVSGVANSGRVVSAAALIMVAVFGGFVFNQDPITKSIAFALAVGVFIDAFLVRMALVPAAMALLGRRAWHLPGWLDRNIPHVDLEGANLPTTEDPTEPTRNPVPTGHGASGS